MTATTKHTKHGHGTDYDVIVIGAGAAGLAATKRLHTQGWNVICLEAADRIGGRAYTDTQIFGTPFDMGAHWLHYEHINPFIGIGQSLGFDLYPAPPDVFTAGDDPSGKALWAAGDTFEKALEHAAKGGQDLSMRDIFSLDTEWSVSGALMEVLSMGRDLSDASIVDWGMAEQGGNWFCKQGFGALVAKTAGDLSIRLNTPVQCITQTGSSVQVGTDQGTLSARTAIVTVSQGVLAAEDIRFNPPLPNTMLRAIDAITMGHYNHAMLQFRPGTLPVQPDTWATYQINKLENDILRGGGFLCDVSGSGLTSFSNAGSFAQELEQAGQPAALDFALVQLAHMFGSDIRKGYIKGHATQWSLNPLTCGAYSGAMPGGAHLRKDLRDPHADRVFFAGEATHLSEQATVSGAHKEGLRVADLIIQNFA